MILQRCKIGHFSNVGSYLRKKTDRGPLNLNFEYHPDLEPNPHDDSRIRTRLALTEVSALQVLLCCCFIYYCSWLLLGYYIYTVSGKKTKSFL